MMSDELKLVVWRDDDNRWAWQIERSGESGERIKGRNVSGQEDTFKAAYDAARKRLNHENRKEE